MTCSAIPTTSRRSASSCARRRTRSSPNTRLRDLAKPVGVSSYITKLVESLPPALRGSLPSPKELEAELKKDAAGED